MKRLLCSTWNILLVVMATLSCALADTHEVKAGPLSISRKAHALIVNAETGGRAYYETRLSRPTWPGGDSGVTVGIGYDLGYNTRTQILHDWSILPELTRNALAACAGTKGEAARVKVSAVRWLMVSWPDAEDVFTVYTMPRFGKMVQTAFPGVLETNGHVQGVTLSLAFNRGTAMAGDSRREMRAVRDHIKADQLARVPADIRAMKRLWVGKRLDGLLKRREDEARLAEQWRE